MTYRQLIKKLETLSGEQLDMDVTVFNQTIDEFYPMLSVELNGEGSIYSDALDFDHPVLVIKS